MKSKEILNSKKLFVFDMDGTIYLGEKPFDFAVKLVKNLRASGKRVLFFTNNASRTSDFYYEKLTRLGFEPTKKEIMTAGDVTLEFLRLHRSGRSVYMVATDELVEEYRKKGINVLNGKDDPKSADIVITSFDTSLTYRKLNVACKLVRNGAEYISTHPDLNCPTEDGFIPDSGAIAALVTASTGVTPTYFGKPYKETAETIAECSGFSPEDICIFGDRLYTDIALGKSFGITACLVLSGETKKSDVDAAKDADRPDFVFNDLSDIDDILFN